jgi:methionine salvage enolase-phosphatase E1
MSRPKKKEIKFSKDSILSLLQEVYNEIVEQRNTAIRIQNKMLAMMKDPEDMQTISPVIKEQQKIINDCVEKKLSLSKLQSSIWEKSQNEKQDFTIDDLDDDLMESLINKDIEKSGETYKLGK